MKKCLYCGKILKNADPKRKYCSILCKTRFYGKLNNYRTGEIKECKQCGKRFKSYRKSNKFCSRQCAVIGRDGPKKKQLNFIVECAFCGKEKTIIKSRIGYSENYFCDSKCYARYKSIDYIGESNPNFKDIPPKICIGCGEEYFSYNNKRKYCSTTCRQGAKKSKSIQALRYGLGAEKKLSKKLRDQNYHVIESKGSRGDFDLVAINENEILLIQVKFTFGERPSDIFNKKTIVRIEKSIIPKTNKIKKQIWTWVEPQKKWHVKDIF